MNVLSLFNGCGMVRPALEKAGIAVDKFYSAEIDKYANKIANKNYPDTIQLGDVNQWQDWDLEPIDILTAGFPCQDLSCAGNQLGLNGERSGLLYEVLKIRDALKPKYFLFENVASMSGHWRDEITRLVGVNPVELNSKYWGAQNRARLFWTNIPGAKNIEMTQVRNDKKIYLKDILIDGAVDCEKSRTLLSSYTGVTETAQQLNRYKNGKPGQLVFIEKPVCLGNVNPSGKGMNGNVFGVLGKSPTLTTNKGEGIKIGITKEEYESLFISSEKKLKILREDKISDDILRVAEFEGGSQGYRVYGRGGKGQALASSAGGLAANTGLVFVKEATKKGYAEANIGDCINLQFPESKKRRGRVGKGKAHTLMTNDELAAVTSLGIRKLHPGECELLMNLPWGYTEGVSNSQRYKMLGNGWDVDVVADLFRGINTPVTEIQPCLFAEAV